MRFGLLLLNGDSPRLKQTWKAVEICVQKTGVRFTGQSSRFKADFHSIGEHHKAFRPRDGFHLCQKLRPQRFVLLQNCLFYRCLWASKQVPWVEHFPRLPVESSAAAQFIVGTSVPMEQGEAYRGQEIQYPLEAEGDTVCWTEQP